MRRFLVIIGITILLIFGVLMIFHKDDNGGLPKENLPNYPTKSAVIRGEKITLLVTRSAKESQLGLGAVPKLPKNYGMLFSANGQMGIWMKGMKYPIDIFWLDEDGKVVHIVHDAQPSSYPKTTFYNPPGTDARTAMELNAGEAKRLKIELGSKIAIE